MRFSRGSYKVQWENPARSGEIHMVAFEKASRRKWYRRLGSEGRNGGRD